MPILDLFRLGDTEVPDASSPWRKNLMRWCLICVGHMCGVCFMSLFWRVHF